MHRNTIEDVTQKRKKKETGRKERERVTISMSRDAALSRCNPLMHFMSHIIN